MGLVRAAVGAVGGTLADQWKDFLTVPPGIPPTAALFPAVRAGTNAARGSNVRGSAAIVTNGSKIVVPEGYGLLLLQDGEIASFTDAPGAYIWDSATLDSQSIFAGAEVERATVTQSWERFKFGGRPGTQQVALFVSLKELPNNRFGTQSEIYWDDAYFNTQVGAIAHGTYTITIVDPILFVKQFVPAHYLQGDAVFDFTDLNNAAANQVFAEVVGCLASAFSIYANDAGKEHRIAKIQQDSIGFADSLSQAVGEAYRWRTDRGLTISRVTIVGIEYGTSTKELLKTVQRADALRGIRGEANLRASLAAGFEAAGEQDGAGGILGVGIAASSAGLASVIHADVKPEITATASRATADDMLASLEKLKQALDAGLIDQADYDRAKARALSIVFGSTTDPA